MSTVTRASGVDVRHDSRVNGPLTLESSYFPAVDGLRALAILSVLVYHTGLYENGLFGVDIFFVLSGFLITVTLLREHHRIGRVDLGTFYVRRAKRLLPLLILLLAVTLLAVVAWGAPREVERFSQQGLAALVYVANWEQIAAGQSYWGGFQALSPLGHMWSLAITEQFYVIWPLLLVGLLAAGRALSRRRDVLVSWQRSEAPAAIVFFVAAGGFVIGAVHTAAMFDGTNSDRVYMGTDTHLAGLLAGAAAAAVSYAHSRRVAERAEAGAVVAPAAVRRGWSALVTTASASCASAIVVLSLHASDYTQPWLYEFGFATVAALGAVLVLTLTSTANLLTRIFALPPLVALGKISYTLFLIHLPIYWAISTVSPWTLPTDLAVLGIPATVLVAFLVHHAIGEPVRKARWGRRGTTAFVGVVVATGVAAWAAPALASPASSGSGQTRVLMLGDSLANDFADALATSFSDEFTVIDGGFAGCGIAESDAQHPAYSDVPLKTVAGCNPWASRWNQKITHAKPDVIVVNIAWDAVPQVFDGLEQDVLDAEYAARYAGNLEQMASILERSGARAIIANSRLHNSAVTPEQATAFNTLLDDVVRDRPTLSVLDLNAEVCSADGCRWLTRDGESMYIDHRVHFSEAGKREIAPWLADSIRASSQEVQQ